MTILEAAQKINARQISSAELVRDALDKANHLQPRYNAFITFMEESALEQARLRDEELARGERRGPLHGIPYAVKDNFYTKGVRTTIGSKIFADFIPDQDAAAIERLTAAGAVLIGKLNMHELAYGITSNNPHYGAVRNPWDKSRVPGGSSGGSAAAIAAGIVPFTLGSDTGGSIRIPASFCGVVGIKPTYGLVSTIGLMPLAETLDHAGPLTQTVNDAQVVLQALAGSSTPGIAMKDVRIGFPERFFFETIDQEVDRAVRSLAAAAVPVSIPDMLDVNETARTIQHYEATRQFKPYIDRRNDIGEDVLALLEFGLSVTKEEYDKALANRQRLQQEMEAVWQQVDCLLMPATAIPAPLIGQKEVELDGKSYDVRLTSTRLTRPWNLLGNPALSIPCGKSSTGLPLGAQLVGPAMHESLLFQIGATFL